MFNLEKYQNEIRTTLFNNFQYEIKNRNIKESKVPKDILKDIILAQLKDREIVGIDLSDEIEESLNENNSFDSIIENNEKFKEIYNILEFILLTTVSAYYKLSNIDIDRLKESDFGYNCCSLMLVNISSNFQSRLADEKIRVELESKLRDIEFIDYISNEFYNNDLDNICELLNKNKQYSSEKDKELLVKIKATFTNKLKGYKYTIQNRYNYMLDGTFGISSYKGVYTGIDNAPFIGIKNGASYTIEPVEQLNNCYHKVLKKYIDLDFSNIQQLTERQFDKQLIYNESNKDGAKPLYFPHKILEIVKLCSYTKNKQVHTYSKLSSKEVGTKEDYINKLSENLINELIDFLFYCYKIELGVHDKAREEANPVIMEFLNREKDNEWMSVYNKMVLKANYFIDCVTTGVILDQLDVNKEVVDKDYPDITVDSIENFRIKLCLPDNNFDFTNANFCSDLRDELNLSSNVMNNFNEEKKTPDNEGYYFLDLEYIFEQEKHYARPIFAYQALEHLLEKQDNRSDGSPLDWNNILLGKNAKDGLVTSSLDSSISLQRHKAHFIYAGSRSGKGVMAYNIFATAIASEIPIFYIDGKPDTSVVLKSIGIDMFALNAGEHDIVMDNRGILSPDKYSYIVPDYLKDRSGFNKKTDLSYFVAFKGIMLVLTMMIYANNENYKYAKELSNKFPKGIILVLDEFTKFQDNFTLKDTGLSSAGIMKEAFISNEKLSNAITSVNKNYKKQVQAIRREARKGEKADNSAIEDMESELAKFNMQNPFDMVKLYATALYNAYKSLATEISNLQNASSRVWNTLQTFVIGQDLKPVYESLETESDFYIENSGSISSSQKARKIDPLVNKLLANMNPDFILGYQPDRTSYMAQNVKGVKTNEYFTPSRRMFAYRDMSLTAENINKIINTDSATKNNPKGFVDNWKFFKPFLILNNSISPADELLNHGLDEKSAIETAINEVINGKDKNGVKLDRNALTDKLRKGVEVEGFTIPYIDSQYVNQCITSCESAGLDYNDLFSSNSIEGHPMTLNPGVGFEGYINMMSCKDAEGSLNKSGEIANYFVNTVLGYNGTWEDFCCDLRPEYWVCPADFDSDGNYKPVQDRLRSSFFNSILLSNNFGEMYGSMTESLAPYYSGLVESGESDEAPDVVSVDDDEFDEDEDNTKDNFGQEGVDFDELNSDSDKENLDDEDLELDDEDLELDDEDLDLDDEDNNLVMNLEDVLDLIDKNTPENANYEQRKQFRSSVISLLRSMGYSFK